jgi:GNAT superfamily N-acetyltransferase
LRLAAFVQLTWVDRERPDPADVTGAVAVLNASNALDAPHLLSYTASMFAAEMSLGWDGDPPEAAVLRDDRRRVVGALTVLLPRWDNRHLAFVDVVVDPAVRRQGLGRLLFAAAVARARDEGRAVVIVQPWDQPHAAGFAAAVGLVRVSEATQQRLDVWTLDRSALDPVRVEVEERAGAYEALRVPGNAPQNLVPGLLRVIESINDAPVDDMDLQHEVSTEDRLRAFEAGQLARGRRLYRVVVRHCASGELAGHTLVGVDAEHPWCGWQLDTSVLAGHRGHRLGLLLKVEMLDWLAEVEPQLRTLDTWNAASNAHMVAVNERIGFRPMASDVAWQLRL